MSVTSWLREAFNESSTVRVVLPWRLGSRSFVAYVRQDCATPFREACEKLGVKPPMDFETRSEEHAEKAKAEIDEQAKSGMREAIQKGRPPKNVKDLEPTLQMFARLSQAMKNGLPDRSDFVADGWDLRYPVYLPGDVAKIAPAVAAHLVEKVEIREGLAWLGEVVDGVASLGEVVDELSPEDIAATFGQTEPLPVAYPDGESVPMAGKPEGEAWALVMLRTAVQRHRFQEVAAPLSEGSRGPEQSADI